MQLVRPPAHHHYIIGSHTQGQIIINETAYTHSLIITPTHLVPNWPPQSVLMLTSAHFLPILKFCPDIVLIGTGAQQQFLPLVLLKEFISQNIAFEMMSTAAACRVFNLLASEARQVVAALIIS